MDTIILSAYVGEDRRLVIDLPPETPVGKVELVIRSTTPDQQMTLEEARAIFRQAGIKPLKIDLPADFVPLSPEALLKVGTLAPGAKSSLDLINEDRGTY